ncbi:MAG: hypothetical protein J5654_07020 [Victivallales bacterium]|nr:hypothetical protein [Victivallales bacterium]
MSKVLTAIFLTALTGMLLAAPVINSLSLRSGTNLPRYNSEIVRAIYDVGNPDDTAAELTVQIVPEGSSGGALYYRSFTLPPHSSITGFIPVTFSSTGKYNYRLIQHSPSGDIEVMHGDLLLTTTRQQGQGAPSPAAQPLANEEAALDAADYLYIGVIRGTFQKTLSSLPNLGKNRALDNASRFLSYSAKSAFSPPANLAEYLQLSAVLLLAEHYDFITPLQFNALRDYVRAGGLLIVGGASPTQGLYDSPLRTLLPVTPAGVRQFEDGNVLRQAWGLPKREYQRRDENGDLIEIPGYDFQEVAVAADATVLKRLDSLPMAVIRPYGLGTVLWLAFDPVDLTDNELEIRATLWNFILRHANHIPRSRRPDTQLLLEGVQQQLLGYSIPPFRTLGIYLVVYLVCAFLLLALCARLHHPATGWGLVCLLGILMTFVIATHAHNLSADQPHRQINSIALRTWDGAPGPQIAYATLASREDTVLNLSLDNGTAFLFPSPPKPSVESTETALERSHLLVDTDGKKTALMRVNLQENRPRSANWFIASRELETPPQSALPTLEIAPDGALGIAEWTIPESLRPFNRALLLLPSAIQPLNHNGERITGIAKDTVENDTVFVQVREFLAARQLRAPAICLVAIRRETATDPEVQIDCEAGAFDTYDYLLTLVPLRLQWPVQGNTFTIPPELTWMTIDSNSYLARVWSFGKCTGLSLATVSAGDGGDQQSRRSRVPVPIAFPPTAPIGEFQSANVQFSLQENSSLVDIVTRVYSPSGDNLAEPTAITPQSSSFGADASLGLDPALARFTVTFVPVPTTSASVEDPLGQGSSSSREQAWWLNQARAALVFRRTTDTTAP